MTIKIHLSHNAYTFNCISKNISNYNLILAIFCKLVVKTILYVSNKKILKMFLSWFTIYQLLYELSLKFFVNQSKKPRKPYYGLSKTAVFLMPDNVVVGTQINIYVRNLFFNYLSVYLAKLITIFL